MKATNTFLSMSALIVGIIALLVAIGAYNRTGTNVKDVAEETIQETGERLGEQVNILDVQTKLLRIQADIQMNRVTDDTRRLISEVRQETEELNIDPNIQRQLQTLETQVRDGSADALRTVEGVLSDIRQDIENDR